MNYSNYSVLSTLTHNRCDACYGDTPELVLSSAGTSTKRSPVFWKDATSAIKAIDLYLRSPLSKLERVDYQQQF